MKKAVAKTIARAAKKTAAKSANSTCLFRFFSFFSRTIVTCGYIKKMEYAQDVYIMALSFYLSPFT